MKYTMLFLLFLIPASHACELLDKDEEYQALSNRASELGDIVFNTDSDNLDPMSEPFRAWSAAQKTLIKRLFTVNTSCMKNEIIRALYANHAMLYNIAENRDVIAELDERLNMMSVLNDRMLKAETILEMPFAPEQCVTDASVKMCFNWANAPETAELFAKTRQMLEFCLEAGPQCNIDKNEDIQDGLLWVHYSYWVLEHLKKFGVNFTSTSLSQKMVSFNAYVDYRSDEIGFDSIEYLSPRLNHYLKEDEIDKIRMQVIFDVYSYKKNGMRSAVNLLVNSYGG